MKYVGLHGKNYRVFLDNEMCNVIMCLEVGLHGKNCRVFWTMFFGQ